MQIQSRLFIQRFLGAWVGMEILVVLGSWFVPAPLVLDQYLSDQAQEQTTRFLSGDSHSFTDDVLGWRSRPSFSDGDYIIDRWGGRHTHEVQLEKTPGTSRIIFLGSSLVNGGSAVDNNHTASALLAAKAKAQGKSIETLNFATMVYALDQIRLQLERDILKFSPDHVFIGLHEDPSLGLGNVYLPFRLIDEENMPYLKPHFELQGTQLTLNPPPLDLLATRDSEFLELLREQDQYWYNFARFQHFAATPIVHGLSQGAFKLGNALSYWFEEESDYALMRRLMWDIEVLADRYHFKVTFLHFPTARALLRQGVWKFIPDYYAHRFDILAAPYPQALLDLNPNVQTTAPSVIAVRESFQASSKGLALYTGDHLHFSKLGMQVMADAFYEYLESGDKLPKASQ